MNYIYL